MSQIQDASVARKLANRFNIKGEAIAPSLADFVIPTVAIDDLSEADQTDTRFKRQCVAGVTEAAGANRSQVQLFNPAGSGVIATVHQMVLSSPTAGSLQVCLHGTAIGAENTSQNLFADRRLAGNPSCNLMRGDAAAAGNVVTTVRNAADSAIVLPCNFILPPGFGVHGRPGANAVAIDVAFFYTERGLLEGESAT